MSEDTIEREIKAGRFPGPRKGRVRKAPLWVWKEVEEYLAADRRMMTPPPARRCKMREAAQEVFQWLKSPAKAFAHIVIHCLSGVDKFGAL